MVPQNQENNIFLNQSRGLRIKNEMNSIPFSQTFQTDGDGYKEGKPILKVLTENCQ